MCNQSDGAVRELFASLIRFPCTIAATILTDLIFFAGLLPGLGLSIPTAPRAGRRSASGRRWILGLCKIYILGELGLVQSRSGFILVGNEAAMEEERRQVDGKLLVECMSLPPYPLAVLIILTCSQKQLGKWISKGGNPNIVHSLHMLTAEHAVIKGNHTKAKESFKKAALVATTNGFVQDKGLANALASAYYAGQGDQYWADYLGERSQEAFREWGAKALVT